MRQQFTKFGSGFIEIPDHFNGEMFTNFKVVMIAYIYLHFSFKCKMFLEGSGVSLCGHDIHMPWSSVVVRVTL